jgi:MtN3 and saliva related transmembrane protein
LIVEPLLIEAWRGRLAPPLEYPATGVALWLLYGIALGSWPVIVCNAITLVLAGGVLYLKLSHR